MKGFIIAGTHSGCGKTTVTLGLLAAIKKIGLTVQSFKAGPDFIDGGLHRLITGRVSRNLDVFMCNEEYIQDYCIKYSSDADISVVEGVMGLYDGEYSTAYLARLLNLPVILVVDAYGLAESAGAVVKGFVDFRKQKTEYKVQNYKSQGGFYSELPIANSQLNLAGIIFNRVASENHYKRLKNSVQDVKVLGYLPRDIDFEIPHRYLGLTVAEENPISKDNIEKLADTVLRHMEMDRIIDGSLSCCHSNESGNPDFKDKTILLSRGKHLDSCLRRNDKTHLPTRPFTHSPMIAIAYDKAFCFYYEDNFELLKDAGTEIVNFSPLDDTKIPDNVDAIYIGGGYPELYAEELSKNVEMIEGIKKWAEEGKPIYAECGGLMYLSEGIYDLKSNFFKMASVFPFKVKMRNKPVLGYRKIKIVNDCILGKKGEILKGHEFHYSEVVRSQESRVISQGKNVLNAYSVSDKDGNYIDDEGFCYKNTLASYVHLHFGSNKDIAKNYVKNIRKKEFF